MPWCLLDANSSARAHHVFGNLFSRREPTGNWAAFTFKPAQVAGHDSDWFLARAREYKTKGQMHNAWLYFRGARSLISPLTLYEHAGHRQARPTKRRELQPTGHPGGGKTADLSRQERHLQNH